MTLKAPKINIPSGKGELLFYDTNWLVDNDVTHKLDRRAVQRFLDNPLAYIPEIALDELYARNKEEVISIFNQGGLESKVIGQVDPRIVGRRGRPINIVIQDNYPEPMSFDYGKQRREIVAEMEQISGKCKTAGEEELPVLNERMRNLRFNYIVNLAFCVSTDVYKKGFEANENVIFDAYTVALAYYTALRSKNPVTLLSDDNDMILISERMNSEIGKRLQKKLGDIDIEIFKRYPPDSKSKILKNIDAEAIALALIYFGAVDEDAPFKVRVADNMCEYRRRNGLP